jgi:quinol monooxygenase YgiN
MSTKLPLIVKFEVKKDRLEFVINELNKILEPTRNEDGCVLYELHQDLDDPYTLMFYEIWETVDAWKAHDQQKHIIDFKKAIDGAVEQITFNKLKII